MARRQNITPAVEAERQKRNGLTAPWKRQRMAARRREAEARQVARDARGDEEQLARLDALLGDGKGAQKERARLVARAFKGFGEKVA